MINMSFAVDNIIADWEYQAEVCERTHPLSAEYEYAYARRSGLDYALQQLKMVGLVEYEEGRWKAAGGAEKF